MKKLALLFIIISVGQFYGMEPEKGRFHVLKKLYDKKKLKTKKLEIEEPEVNEGTENLYKQLPKELQQQIVNYTLTSSTNIAEVINTIEKLTVLHNVSFDKNRVINVLSKKFPNKIKEEIVLAVENPHIYQKLIMFLIENKGICFTRYSLIKSIERANLLLPDNLKDFIGFIQIFGDAFKMTSVDIADSFDFIQTKKEYDSFRISKADMGLSDYEMNKEYMRHKKNKNKVRVRTECIDQYNDLKNKLLNMLKLLKYESSQDTIKHVTALIQRGADVNYTNRSENKISNGVLQHAILDSNVKAVQFLLEQGARPMEYQLYYLQYMKQKKPDDEHLNLIRQLIEDASVIVK